MIRITTFALAALAPFVGAQEPSEPDAHRPEPMPIPRTAILHRGDREIVVDGSLQDWPALPPIVLADVRQLSGTAQGAWRGGDDLTAKVFLTWDEDALWLSASVRDDWHIRLTREGPRLSEIPAADSLTVSLDPARDSRSLGNDLGRAEDVEVWLAQVEGQGKRVVQWNRFRGVANFMDGAEAVVRHDDGAGVTYYEARIPWRAVLPHGEDAATGRAFDLQFVVDDYDEPTDPMPQTRVGWTFGMGPRIDPMLFGSAILVDASSEDLGGAAIPVPEIPAPPSIAEPPVPADDHWIALWDRLRAAPPAVVDESTAEPRFAGGAERTAVLADLDRHHAEFPRVDFLQFQNRIHRRMTRESAGIAARGLPFFWDHVLQRTMRDLEAGEPPERGFRLLRLPQNGWLVVSAEATFAIDPAGHLLERALLPLLDFVILTMPVDPTRRNDQLLVRMRAEELGKPVLTHVAFHLPALGVQDLPLVAPGATYEPGNLRVDVLGVVDEEGMVTASVGYRITWPDGSDLLVSGLALRPEDVDQEARPDCLLLSAVHPEAEALARRTQPDVVVLADVLQCAVAPGAAGRVSLEQVFELQGQLRPLRSVLLAPGEAWYVAPGGD